MYFATGEINDMNDQDLGRIRGVFRPVYGNVIVGFIFGVVSIGGGCALVSHAANRVIENHGRLPLWVEEGWCWGSVALYAALGIGLILGGFFFIRWMRTLISVRITVGTHGLSVTRMGETHCYAWSDIVSVEETRPSEPVVHHGVLEHALPNQTNETFCIKFHEGESLVLDVNLVAGHVMLARMIKKDTDKLEIPWEIVETHV